MTPERWQRAENLARAALGRPPAERADFLAEGSAGDAELRLKADELLSFYVRADAEEAVGLAPGEDAGGMLRTVPIESLAGRVLGQYRVEREIGRGGMGEVYLARDTRLDRPVALKLLPPFLTSDPARARRFEREARSASSLNHPNIITVHEFGESDGLRFIVTEYVEGRTLKELIDSGGLELGRVLDTAVQIASALEAAHRVGVVHRDVKPENVMVRDDGYVKVLDFGLAKPTAHRRPARPSDTAPTVLVTNPGVIMGTVSYMSPEQARGEEVDQRSDIFSLGVVLYEMLTRQRPFVGETVSHTMVAILEREPAPLSEYAPETPAELQQVVSKALRKDRAERYQTMGELLAELREVREEVKFRARQELHLSGGGAADGAARNDAARGQAKRGRGRAALWAAALSVAVATLAFGAYVYVRTKRAAPLPPAPTSVKMNRITANGKVWTAAVSRDGRHVAYAAGPDRQQGLWVMQTGTGSGVQIIPAADEVGYDGVTFSPDGDYVYYVRKVGNSPSELYRVPTLGGTPKRLLADLATAVDFSPDGRQIAFVRHVFRSEPLTESKLVVANADGTGERVLAARKTPGYYGAAMHWRVAWSPDGEHIACPAREKNSAGELKIEVVAVSVKDGSERPLTSQKWYHIKQVAWLGDNSGLIIVGRMQATAVAQVWHLSYPGGELRRISNDFSVYDDVSVTADSSTIVTVQRERLANVWVAPDADAARARQITDSREDGYGGVAWTPDGRVVFSSKVGSSTNIWVVDADGGNRKRLTDSEASDTKPSVSPDGRYVVFESSRGGGVSSIWRVDIEGAPPVRLTEGNSAMLAHCSPDGRWVYYSAAGPGEEVLSTWRVPIEGGKQERVLDRVSALMGISPDGKWLAYSYVDTQMKPPSGVAVVPVEGGAPVKLFDINAERLVRWTPDGRALAYIDHRNQNVWAQPIDGGAAPRQLTDFKTDQTFSFDWSRDGKLLALARGSQTSDVVTITDFR